MLEYSKFKLSTEQLLITGGNEKTTAEEEAKGFFSRKSIKLTFASFFFFIVRDKILGFNGVVAGLDKGADEMKKQTNCRQNCL